MKGFAPPPRFGGSQIPMEPLPITRTITVTEGISVKDLAEKLEVRGKDLIATLLVRGVMVTVNQSLDAELVKDVARQFGADTNIISFEDEMANEALESFMATDNTGEIEVPRPPVVTSITVRRRCSMRFAKPKWQQAKLAASRNISAPTRSGLQSRIRQHLAARSSSSIRQVTKPLPACVLAALR
jgi:hypothetical protein